MSRARETTHVHVVADHVDQAIDDLRREWSTERRERWVLDTDSMAQAGDQRRPGLAARVSSTLRGARLRAERAAVLATLPPDRSAEIMSAHAAIGRLRQQLEDIRRARGPMDGSPLSGARLDLWHADAHVKHVEERLRSTTLGRRERRQLGRERDRAIARADAARDRYDELLSPLRDDVTASLDSASEDLNTLTRADSDRRLRSKLAGVERRVASLDRELGVDHGAEIEERGFGVEL